MNCYFHPQTEAVVTCGKCGVAMCRECESKAFFRLDDGKGQALCNRCSLEEAQANVAYEASWLKKRLVKLIITAVLVIIGIILYNSATDVNGIFTMFLCFFIAGLVGNIGLKKDPQSVKTQVKTAVNEVRYPIATTIGKIIGTTICAPIFLITGFIGYLRTKSAYNQDLKVLETIQASVNQ